MFNATTNGVFLSINKFNDSIVCFSILCIISITTIAKSHNDEPLDLKFANDSWPGVSITNKPGILTSTSNIYLLNLSTSSLSFDYGKNDAPIYYVIPPSSPNYTLVFLILSKILVLPVSTCPIIQIIGHLNSLVDLNTLSGSANSLSFSFSYSSFNFYSSNFFYSNIFFLYYSSLSYSYFFFLSSSYFFFNSSYSSLSSSNKFSQSSISSNPTS